MYKPTIVMCSVGIFLLSFLSCSEADKRAAAQADQEKMEMMKVINQDPKLTDEEKFKERTRLALSMQASYLPMHHIFKTNANWFQELGEMCFATNETIQKQPFLKNWSASYDPKKGWTENQYIKSLYAYLEQIQYIKKDDNGNFTESRKRIESIDQERILNYSICLYKNAQTGIEASKCSTPDAPPKASFSGGKQSEWVSA